jgi:signal transduction histidine kinase
MGRRHRGTTRSQAPVGGVGQAQPFEAAGVANLVLEAAATLSHVNAPEDLLARFLRVCLEATAAERGALLLEEGGELMVCALAGAEGEVAMQRTPLASCSEVPQGLIEEVRRSGERMIVDPCAEPGGEPRCLLALPVHREHDFIGVLTLDGHGFARDAVHVVRLLSSHFAHALERARLVERLTREASDRQRAEAALRFVAEASTTLAESLDYEEALRRVVDLAVLFLADWCVIDLLDEHGILRRVAAGHRDPAAQELLLEIRRRHRDWGSPRIAEEVLAGGRSLLFTEVTDEVLERYVEDPEVRALVRRLGNYSGMAVPLVVHGRAIGVMTFSSSSPQRRFEMTDLALAEELARRAAVAIDNARLYREAQQAVQLRDDFLSIASHELNTPVTSLQMLVDGLDPNALAGRPEALARMVQLVGRQVGRVGRLVRELLDVQRIQVGALALELEPVDLVALVEELVARQAQEIAQAGCELSLHAPSRLEGRWDRMRLEQVVTNLLSNALKFGRGQSIALTLAELPGDWACLIIQDHGIGIPPERLPHIFGRFERAVSAHSYGGLGLGLYIVHEIVAALHGTVTAQSTPGRGATFTVELPRGSAPQGAG